MKKLKLIFGLLIAVSFITTIVLNSTINSEQAIRKGPNMVIPTKG